MGLIILCLLVYIPGLWTIPPVDRDESRFAQASRQMLESGTLEGWVVPRVQDKPRLNKPPLIYWMQAGSAALLGDAPGEWAWLDKGSENIWVYRVPSVLSAVAAVLLTWRLGVRMFDPRAAWLAGALLAVCPMVVWDAHQARADQLLLATTTATMLALWCVWSQWRVHHGDTETRRKTQEKDALSPASPSVSPCLRGESSFLWAAAFWLFLALGIMTKGPITPMIAALTCVALSLVSRDFRWLRRLRPVLGLVIVAAVVAPWVCLVGREVGWSNYLSIIYDETIGRSAGAKEGHWGPPGYHIVLLGALFWPGSLLTAAAIGRAWKRGMHPAPAPPRRSVVATAFRRVLTARPSRRAELFLLAWMLPAWIVFELISTKLPHYTMPLYPAVALMSARAVLGIASRARSYASLPPGRAGLIMWMLLGALLLAVLPCVITLGGNVPEFVGWGHTLMTLATFGIAALAVLIAAAISWRRRRPLAIQLAGLFAMPVFAVTLFHFTLPHAEYLWVSRSLTRAASGISPRRPLASVGFNEDSLVFLRRGDIHRIPIDSLAAWIADHPDGIVAVTKPALFPDHEDLLDSLPLREAAHINGFNYSTGDAAHMNIYEVTP